MVFTSLSLLLVLSCPSLRSPHSLTDTPLPCQQLRCALWAVSFPLQLHRSCQWRQVGVSPFFRRDCFGYMICPGSLSHLVRTRTRVSGLGALPVLCTSRWTVPRPCLPFPEIQNSRPGIILSHLTALGYWVPFFWDLQHILICMLKTVTVFLSQSFKIKTFKSTHIPTLVLEPCTNFPPTSVHGHIWQRLDFCSLQQNDFYHFSSQHTDVLGNAVMSV